MDVNTDTAPKARANGRFVAKDTTAPKVAGTTGSVLTMVFPKSFKKVGGRTSYDFDGLGTKKNNVLRILNEKDGEGNWTKLAGKNAASSASGWERKNPGKILRTVAERYTDGPNKGKIKYHPDTRVPVAMLIVRIA